MLSQPSKWGLPATLSVLQPQPRHLLSEVEGGRGVGWTVWEPLRLRLITLSGATALGAGHPHCPLLCQSGAGEGGCSSI